MDFKTFLIGLLLVLPLCILKNALFSIFRDKEEYTKKKFVRDALIFAAMFTAIYFVIFLVHEKTDLFSNDATKIKIKIENNSPYSVFVDRWDIESNICNANVSESGLEFNFYSSLDYVDMSDGVDGSFEIEVAPFKSFTFNRKIEKNDYSLLLRTAEKKFVKYYFYVSPAKYYYGNYRQYADFLNKKGIRLEGEVVGKALVFKVE